MIKKKTVFVLGAGASHPYGFPLGRELVFEVPKRLRVTTKRLSGEFIRLFQDADDAYDIDGFTQKLIGSNLSVDAYLEHHPEHLKIGKAGIALCLIPHENINGLVRNESERKWYEYLFQQMGSNPDEFRQSVNSLSVITFNYDRSFEYFIFNSTSDAFGEQFAVNTLKEFSIIHVYGQLGSPKFLTKNDQDTSKYRRDYSETLKEDIISACTSEIKIMPERMDDSREFALAQQLISNAHSLCFFGFGYDATNLRRLKLDEYFNGKLIFGTAFGMYADEHRRTRMLFDRDRGTKPNLASMLVLGNGDEDVLTFLRNRPVFD